MQLLVRMINMRSFFFVSVAHIKKRASTVPHLVVIPQTTEPGSHSAYPSLHPSSGESSDGPSSSPSEHLNRALTIPCPSERMSEAPERYAPSPLHVSTAPVLREKPYMVHVHHVQL